jgi:gliding motility-associated-like protein
MVKVTRNNCPTFLSTTLKVFPAVKINPINDVTICEGESTQLFENGLNATHYKWSPSKGLDHDDIPNPIASPTETTTYSVEVSNDGCPDMKPTTSVTVTVLKKTFADAGKSIKMNEGEIARLNGKASGDSISYYWTPSTYLDNPRSLTPNTSSPDDIIYTLHVESNAGCAESTSNVFVRVYKSLTTPNSFSPNGDGINDYWDIKNISSYPKAEISVFARSGQKIYHSIGYGNAWDGTYNGKKLPIGTYYYIIDLREDDLPQKTGWVFIVR